MSFIDVHMFKIQLNSIIGFLRCLCLWYKLFTRCDHVPIPNIFNMLAMTGILCHSCVDHPEFCHWDNPKQIPEIGHFFHLFFIRYPKGQYWWWCQLFLIKLNILFGNIFLKLPYSGNGPEMRFLTCPSSWRHEQTYNYVRFLLDSTGDIYQVCWALESLTVSWRSFRSVSRLLNYLVQYLHRVRVIFPSRPGKITVWSPLLFWLFETILYVTKIQLKTEN